MTIPNNRPAMKRIPSRLQVIAHLLGLFLTGSCAAQNPTLKDLLDQNGIPTQSFSASELAKEVDGGTGAKDDLSMVAYAVRQGESLTGEIGLVRYDAATQKLDRKTMDFKDDDLCGGSPLGVQFLGRFAWLSLHFNPSANCLLALDEQLTVQAKVFGFSLTEVAPDQLIFTEGMMQFAPIHAERLQLIDLRSRTALELYPPEHDALRKRFEAEHEKHMPPKNICATNQNDYCDASMFDESISAIRVLKEGGLTFLAHWDASHVIKAGDDPETVASETNQYVYLYQAGKWLFCDVKVSDGGDAEANVSAALMRENPLPCVPKTPVTPDTGSADLSPFPPPEFSPDAKQGSRDHR
jgi:hypothetical protein